MRSFWIFNNTGDKTRSRVCRGFCGAVQIHSYLLNTQKCFWNIERLVYFSKYYFDSLNCRQVQQRLSTAVPSSSIETKLSTVLRPSQNCRQVLLSELSTEFYNKSRFFKILVTVDSGSGLLIGLCVFFFISEAKLSTSLLDCRQLLLAICTFNYLF